MPEGGHLSLFFDRHRPRPDSIDVEPKDRHAVAAMALHGQPFGFTHEDVRLLRNSADNVVSDSNWHYADAEALNALADRIEKLLPPK